MFYLLFMSKECVIINGFYCNVWWEKNMIVGFIFVFVKIIILIGMWIFYFRL